LFVLRRWDVDAVYHPAAPVLASGAAGQCATRFGTFLPNVHSFDPTAFGLSVTEAAVMVRPKLQLDAVLEG
jgi:acyl transferase domain-containing protein